MRPAPEELAAVIALVVALTVVLLVALAAALAAERWARTRGLELAARRLTAQLGTSTPVALDAPARPLVPALLTGTASHLVASDVPVGDAAIRDLSATVRDVRLRPFARELITGPGTFTARIDEAELGRLVRLPGVVTRLEVRASGLRVWTLLAVAVDADVLVVDGALRVIPDPAQVARLLELPGLGAFRRAIAGTGLRLELPPLPFGATVEDLRFLDGQVEVTGRLDPRTFPVRAAGVWRGQPRQRRR